MRLHELSERALTELRREQMGFVFQSFNLVPALTARQNVELPLRPAGREIDTAVIDRGLAEVGLAERHSRFVSPPGPCSVQRATGPKVT